MGSVVAWNHVLVHVPVSDFLKFPLKTSSSYVHLWKVSQEILLGCCSIFEPLIETVILIAWEWQVYIADMLLSLSYSWLYKCFSETHYVCFNISLLSFKIIESSFLTSYSTLMLSNSHRFIKAKLLNTFDFTCILKKITNLFLHKPEIFIIFLSLKLMINFFKNSFSIKSLMELMRTTCLLNVQENYLIPSQVHMITNCRLRMPTMELLPLIWHMLFWDEKVER